MSGRSGIASSTPSLFRNLTEKYRCKADARTPHEAKDCPRKFEDRRCFSCGLYRHPAVNCPKHPRTDTQMGNPEAGPSAGGLRSSNPSEGPTTQPETAPPIPSGTEALRPTPLGDSAQSAPFTNTTKVPADPGLFSASGFAAEPHPEPMYAAPTTSPPIIETTINNVDGMMATAISEETIA